MQPDGIYPSFADLRSAHREHHRMKRYPRKVSRSRRYCCEVCRPRYHWMRMHRAEEAQYTIQNRLWDDDFTAERTFKEELEHMDVVVLYNRFGKRREVIERVDDVERTAGETFEQWELRRIGGLQIIEEEQFRESQPTTLQDKSADGTRTPGSNTYAMTLPSSALDACAHENLRTSLKHNLYLLRWLRAKELVPLTQAEGFKWFGECCWQWHRNWSGCWELGYSGCNSPLICQFDTFGGRMHPCYCSGFGDAMDPEAQQSCGMIEWASERLRQVLILDIVVMTGPREELSVSAEGHHGWDMVSNAASEDWSMVPLEPDFEMV